MPKNPEDPVVVGAFMNEMEARLVAQELEARGIPASTLGHLTAGFRAEAPGMANVIVQRRHEREAREIILEMQNEKVEVDWSGVDFSGLDQDAADDEVALDEEGFDDEGDPDDDEGGGRGRAGPSEPRSAS